MPHYWEKRNLSFHVAGYPGILIFSSLMPPTADQREVLSCLVGLLEVSSSPFPLPLSETRSPHLSQGPLPCLICFAPLMLTPCTSRTSQLPEASPEGALRLYISCALPSSRMFLHSTATSSSPPPLWNPNYLRSIFLHPVQCYVYTLTKGHLL